MVPSFTTLGKLLEKSISVFTFGSGEARVSGTAHQQTDTETQDAEEHLDLLLGCSSGCTPGNEPSESWVLQCCCRLMPCPSITLPQQQ
jgi:hypothetical protein